MDWKGYDACLINQSDLKPSIDHGLVQDCNTSIANELEFVSNGGIAVLHKYSSWESKN